MTKKLSRIKRGVRRRTIFFLILAITANTFAWFIYSNKISNSIKYLSNKIYAQYGIYLLFFSDTFSSANLKNPASIVALIIRDTIAIFLASIQNLSLNTTFATSISLTSQQHFPYL